MAQPQLDATTRRDVWLVLAVFAVSWLASAFLGLYELIDRATARWPWSNDVVIAGAATAVVLLVLWSLRLRDSARTKDQYRFLFDGNPYPMWIYDRESLRVLEVNEAACGQYGYNREEFLKLSILDLRPEEDREAVTQAVAADGPVHGSMWRHRTRDGRLLEVEITSQLLRWRGRDCRMTLARDLTEQRQAQLRLRQSQEQLQLILDSTNEALYAVDLDVRCVWCNPAAARMLGFADAASMIGQDMRELARRRSRYGESATAAEGETMRSARRGAGLEVEGELLWRRDGSSFHGDYRSSPILHDGVLQGVVVRIADAERRIQAEAAQRQSEARLQALIQANIVGVAVGRFDGVMIEANDHYLDLIGYSRDELAAGQVRWDTVTASEFRADQLTAVALLRAGKPVPPRRTELVRRDGRRIPVMVALVPQPDSALNITLDLSRLQQTENSLRAAEFRYRALFERNLSAVFVMDLDGRFLELNPAMRRILGADAGEALTGQPADRYFANLRALVAEVQQSGSISHRELNILQAGSSPVPVLANISFIRAAAGEGGAIEGILTDLAEYKSIEAQLFQAQKMEGIGQLAGGIAHDFNNLLTVINGYCGLAIAKTEPGEARHRLELIAKAGARAATLTNQLLAFSRKQVFELRVLDLNAVVADAEKLLRPMVGERFQLETALDAKLYPVQADPNKLIQVLVNLVVNAKDAMPNGGRIVIETHNVTLDKAFAETQREIAAGRYAMFAVTDAGTGMDQATQARAFEPFFTTKPVGKGTGLGLATVFGIVKQSGGAVSIYSELGIGTSIRVYLPAHEAAGAAAKLQAEAPAIAYGTETILFVEDEALVRDFGADSLRANGYRVITAVDAVDAVAKCEHYGDALDLLVTDVVMPQMDGPTLATQLRRRWPQLRTLFVSGYPRNAITNIGGLGPNDAFLHKPYSADLLAAKVRQVMDDAAARSHIA